MKKSSNSEAGLKKSIAYKKACISERFFRKTPFNSLKGSSEKAAILNPSGNSLKRVFDQVCISAMFFGL